MQPPMLKYFNITEQIKVHIRQQHQISGNKKADLTRQSKRSALQTTPNHTRKGAIQYATV